MRKGYFVHRRFGARAKGGVTVYFTLMENGRDGDHGSVFRVDYAVASCALSDNFTRRIGRSISEGRYKAGKFLTFFFTTHPEQAKEVAMERIQKICDYELSEIQERHETKIRGLVRHYEIAVRLGGGS